MRKHKLILLTTMILTGLIALGGIAQPAAPIQLTNNDVDDEGAVIDGKNIVWMREDSGGYSVLRYNGSSIETITSSPDEINGIKASGDNIVWEQTVGGNSEIMFFNGSTVATITSTPWNDNSLDIDGNNYVWQSFFGGSDYEIFLKKGTAVYKLSDNDVPDERPKVSGDSVVWRSGNDTDTIVHYKNGVTTTLSPGPTVAIPAKLPVASAEPSGRTATP